MLTVGIVGCGDAFGTGGRLHTCIALRGDGHLVLLDCGASAVGGFERLGISPLDISAVVVSHLHGDHFGGVPFLLLDAAYNRPRAAPLHIGGPPGIERRVLDTLDLLYPGMTATVMARVPVTFTELAERSPGEVGPSRVTALPAVHGGGAPAFVLRVELAGRVVAFSGDTEWTPALAEAANGADLFICECTAWDEPLPSHLSHGTLLAHAGELHARRILLTHLGPGMLPRASGARWPCAEDGLVLEL